MRRPLLLAAIALALAVQASAAEKWIENYNKGVEAVNARRYDAAATFLQKAIAERPMEGTELKVSLTIVAAYTPHFWLGIAKFNLSDVDGALREWRISEEQGAIARTPYYSRLKDWVARAQTEKGLQAEKAASGAKKAADAAIRRAVELQGDALSAGGDRTDDYRDAQRKLQDALTLFRKSGTDSASYERSGNLAQQAGESFSSAAEEGKRLRAAAANRPKPVPAKPTEVVVPFDEPTTTVAPDPTPAPPPVEPVKPPGKRVIVIDGSANKPAPPVTTTVEPEPAKPLPITTTAAPVQPAPVKADVTPAYRAFATGDLATAERLLDNMIATTPAAEAFLLRGCVRYTRAMLSRTPEPLLLAATNDFKSALSRNRALRLDRRVFSPKLVERFEQVRKGGG